jgi:Lrp/AsnC family transcriptional regulator for asnA, asnC and gidA
MDTNQLDPIDVLILKELTSDARLPFVKLAKKLKVSNTLIHQRVRKLKEAGIINQASFRLDPWRLGYKTSAYTQILLADAQHHRNVEEQLKEIPEIVECVNISGRYALLVKIYAYDNRHLRDVIYDQILRIDGVEGTNSTISFETAFVRNVPLEVER